MDAVVVSLSPLLGVALLTALLGWNARVHHVATARAASHGSIGAAVVAVGAAPASRSQLLIPPPPDTRLPFIQGEAQCDQKDRRTLPKSYVF